MTLRTLIVDDERLGIDRIQELLQDEADIEVVGTCQGGMLALEALRSLQVDLVFLDIRMPGMDGFEVLARMEGPLPLVVFVTAFDQYALQAFDVHAVDYILKPIQEERFRAALTRIRQLMARGEQELSVRRVVDLLESMQIQRKASERFVVKDRDQIRFIPAEDVEAIEATGNYVHLHQGRQSHMIRCHLNELEAGLAKGRFVRTHRSWLVNLDHVLSVRLLASGGYLLELRGGGQVPVSKGRREIVEAMIRNPIPM